MGFGDKPHGSQIVRYKFAPFRSCFFVRYYAIVGAFVYRNDPKLSTGVSGRKCVEISETGYIQIKQGL